VANAKIIEQKAAVVSEIKDRFEKAKSVVLFDYRGLSVSEVTELRRKLRENGADYKVYKNTLTKRALDELNIDMNEYLAGPSAVSFGTDELSIVKVLNDLMNPECRESYNIKNQYIKNFTNAKTECYALISGYETAKASAESIVKYFNSAQYVICNNRYFDTSANY
jgi:ribosomal protein L10